tara:strand:- start:108479 stop:111745 length:3267 start_codon:yes stop_codon:yes gene_type:complete
MAARLVPLSLLIALAAPVLAQDSAPSTDLSLLTKLKARAIGPAVVGGRIGAVAGVAGDPRIIWAGAAAGGVWKSTDGGITFTALFDDQDVASIGAIAVNQQSPDIVWVGSGEGNPRNSASVGRGIYKTLDGGRTWTKLGLAKTERIHRIVLHPSDANTAWVSAFGTSWGENAERGVFKTTDGGATWDKVLYVDERTGCSDLIIDPRNPDKLFASMWQHRRWPWAFKSGGPGSGLYRTLDGGKNWKKLDSDDGLPKGELGRIGLAISASSPNTIYALTEAKKSVLLRSDDGGFKFRTVNSNDGVAPRPFYFCDIRVDPKDPNRIYNMHTVIDVSTDGGRSFNSLVGWGAAHPDHHSMWIDPVDPQRILIGNDGGVYTSRDQGSTWRFCRNLPLAQFYHVAVDYNVPYNIYGGLQDNGSWRGPSNVWENGGIRNLHWQEVCFGDGFATVPDPFDSRQGYAMSQGGSLVRYDLRTGARKSIRPPEPEGSKLRFHWNAAIALDPFDGRTVYYGSQFVHRSPNRGEAWSVISPDLTTNNPEWQKQEESGGLTIDVTAAENHCCILTIAPSRVARGVVWAGTDDGRVQVTRDGGDSWTSVESNVPDLPRNTWCPHIEASKYDAATAFAVFDGHRNSDWTSYVYVTHDYGATWTSLATEAIDGYCHVIEQDPKQKDLLWVGTEFGLFVSLDGGKQWHAWRHGVPTCAARAITTHARDGDLIVATHGRSIFVIDDISPLRSMTPEMLEKKLHVFEARPAFMHGIAQTPSTRFPGQGEFRGPTKPFGVMVQLLANAKELKHPDPKIEKTREKPKKPKKPKKDDEKKSADDEQADGDDAKDDDPKDKVTVEVKDSTGTIIRTFRRDVHLGLNRIYWRFERDGGPGPSRTFQKKPKMPPAGRRVLAGNYELTVRFQGESQTIKVEVLDDPRLSISRTASISKDVLRTQQEELNLRLHEVTQRLAPIKGQIDVVRARLAIEQKPEEGDDPHKAIRTALKAIDKAHKDLNNKIWGEQKKVQGISRGNDGLMTKIRGHMRISSSLDKPNKTERDGMAKAAQQVDELEALAASFFAKALPTFRKAVADSGLHLLPVEPDSSNK